MTFLLIRERLAFFGASVGDLLVEVHAEARAKGN